MKPTDQTTRGAANAPTVLGSWLLPTPLADDGAPIRTRNPQLTSPAMSSPVLGKTHDINGVTLREVTFVYENATAVEVMVHLNGLTDNHRKNIEPARLQRVASTDLYALTYLLPDDGTWSYRYVVRDHLPHDVGAERSGWVSIHADGQPDPLCNETLRHPHGEKSSVLRMPAAPCRTEWRMHATTPNTTPDTWTRLELIELPDVPGVVACHYLPSGYSNAPLLILFDAEQLITMPLANAITQYHHAIDVLLIESGRPERRAAVLPHPEHSTTLVRNALTVLTEHDRRHRDAVDVIVAGVSFGGLAAASVVVHAPDLAQCAIVQSGSFWYHPDREARHDDNRPGALLESITGHCPPATDTQPPPHHQGKDTHATQGGDLSGRRFIVHVGTDEGTMADGARQFTEAVHARNAAVHSHQYRGGHDWAWWSHALFDGLDELLDT